MTFSYNVLSNASTHNIYKVKLKNEIKIPRTVFLLMRGYLPDFYWIDDNEKSGKSTDLPLLFVLLSFFLKKQIEY